MSRLKHHRALAANLGVVIVLVALGAGCWRPVDDSVQRLTPEIPEERFRVSHHAGTQLFHWAFDSEADLLPWRVRADRAELHDGALWVQTADRASLVRRVDFEAGEVDSILMQLQGLQQGRTEVSWAGAGEPFLADKMVTLRANAAVNDVFEFRVENHPRWTGGIRRLRFVVAARFGGRVGLASIAGVHGDSTVAGNALDRPWRLEIDNELRAGFVVTPRQRQIRSISASRPTRLHFAFGLLVPPTRGIARFSITRLGPDGDTEIFAMAGPDTIGSPRKWIDSAVELGRAVRGEVALAFSVECPESDSCVGAFASLEARSRDESSQPNVVLISIDTLRADRMSLYGNPRLTTARIDRWAEDRGVTFEQAVVQAPWTLPSHISILTGLNPTTHGVNHRTAAPVELELLAERLRSKGYFTAAVTGGGFMSPHFGIWQGFDVFRYWGEDSETLPTVEVTGGVSRALELVDGIGERPFFLLFHTFEVHNPYHPQPPYFRAFYDGFAHSRSTISTREVDRRPVGDHRVFRELIWRRSDGQVSRLPDERRPLALAMYDSGLAYTDEQIGRLLDELDARGLSENTIVVLTSDHGELLGEEGLGGHVYLHDANLLVPLVFSWPEELVGSRRIDVQVRSIDIVPTLLELLGVDETGDLDGVSLVPLLRDEVEPAVPEAITYAASSNRGVSVRIDNRFKYTYDDTLWRSGFVESFRSIGTNSLAAPVDRGTRVTRLRHQVERLLDGRDGLKMHLANKEGPGDLVVRLQGPMVQVKNLKATGLQCECAHWLDRSSAEVALPRDHGFTIHFDDVSAGILSVELRSDDAVYNAELDVSNLGAGVAITLSDGVWAESERLDKLVQRGIALWWQGAAPLAENALLDEEVLQRLRALGYIR